MKKNIATTLNEYLNSKVFEYLTNDEIYLKNYLSMSQEEKMSYLPHEYYEFFDDFLEETDTDFDMPKDSKRSNYMDEPDEEVNMFDNNLELMTWIENNNKELYNSFAKYLYDKLVNETLPIPDSDYPAWVYFDENPKVVKNQWLIHFTNNANEIAQQGFKFGIDDMTKLGLTTHISDFEKQYGGYNFAYLLSDFPKYASRSYVYGGGLKYGKEAVVFNASGIKVWHNSDEEPQVIFYGNTARNITPITKGENLNYAIYAKNGRVIYENDKLEEVVNWLTTNYQQYHRIISYR